MCAVAVAGDVHLAVEVANIFCWVICRAKRTSLPVLPRLRTECRIRPIHSSAVERLDPQGKILLPQEAAGIVSRLEGNA